MLWRYLGGATAARTGDEMSAPALLVLAVTATGSVPAASALLTGLTISAAAGGPFLGALLDRSGRPGAVLAVALGCYAAGFGVLVAGIGHLPVAVLVLVAAVTGLAGPAVSGGWTAQLPLVTSAARFARANAGDAMTFNAAGLAGPALAGLLANTLGAPAAMVVAAALVAAAVPVALFLPGRARHAPDGPRIRLRADLFAGARAIAANRALRRATATSVVSFVGFGMFLVCCPLLGERAFDEAGYGALLLSAMAAAALLAGAVLARHPAAMIPDRIVLASTFALSAGMALAGLATVPWLTVAAAVIAGIGDGPQLAALFAIRHREAPEHVRAQVFTVGASLKITAIAVGSALAGWLAAHSLAACLATAAGVELAAALTYLVVSVWKR